MSEYNHIDEKEYLIAEGPEFRVWNNGIMENMRWRGEWTEQNSDLTWEQRLKFLKYWEDVPVGSWTEVISYNGAIRIVDHKLYQKFLGFRAEECPECKQSNLVWEGKIQLCKGCDYIHAFEYDDS